jgi:hypothetical protein
LEKRNKSGGASDSILKKLDPLEAAVEVPFRFPSDAASVHFAAAVGQTSPQSSCSVPLTKFIDIYYKLVPRCYKSLEWPV